jgi:hypothetical protein
MIEKNILQTSRLNELQLLYAEDNQILESTTSKTVHKVTLFSVLKLQYNRLQKSITHNNKRR